MANLPNPEFTVGERIAFFRSRKRGMTQEVLGGLVGRTGDWMGRVERNVIGIDSIKMLVKIKTALGVRNLSDLTGDIYLPLTEDDGPEHPAVAGIRRALYTQPSRLAANATQVLEPAEVAQRVDEVWKVYEHDTVRYSVIGPLLPNLLAEVHAAAAADEEAARPLISCYHLLQVFLRRIGERALSQIAADRALSLADQIGDPELIAASVWNVCSILTNLGHVEESADLALATIDQYQPGPDASPSYLAAVGALHLSASIASVRADAGPRAWDLNKRAQKIADRIGGDTNHWRTSFGPTNVGMHRVHLAAEESDPRAALRYADTVKVNTDLPLERITRYYIEMMHAHRLNQDLMGTMYVARRIIKISPEEAKLHPLMRSAAVDLLARMRPTHQDEARKIAAHVGVLS